MAISSKEQDQIRKDLMTKDNMGEIFQYISNYFDLFSKPLPGLYKILIVNGIVQAINWIQPNKK